MAERQEDECCGYDKRMFVSREMVSQYLCGKCLKVLKNPVQIANCGHRFCCACLPDDAK